MQTIVRLLCLASICLASNYISAQQIITFSDSQSNERLPGVVISFEDNTTAIIADAEGKVYLNRELPGNKAFINYLGYNSLEMTLEELKTRSSIQMEPAVFLLNQVVASASRVRQNRSEVPAAISSISQAQILQTRPTLIGQLINKVPGVYMNNLGNEQHTMSIRQPISSKPYYLYLENGIPIRPLGIFNHNSLYEMNLAGAERVEIIKGPSSSIYGSNAIGGALNFIGFEPTLDPSMEISIQGDNQGYRRIDLVSGIEKGKFGATLSGYYAQNTDGFRDFTQFNKTAISPRIFFQINDKTKLEVSATYIDYNVNLPGSLDSVQYAERSRFNRYTFTYRNISALRTQASLDHRINLNHSINVSAFFRDNTFFFNSDHTIRDVASDPTRATGSLADNSFNGGGFLMSHKWNLGKGRLITGVYGDFNKNTLYDELLDITRENINGNDQYTSFRQTGTFTRDYTVGLVNIAGFTQYEQSLTDRLRLVAGLRYDHVQYDFKNKLIPSNTTGAPDEIRNFQNLSYKAGLTYQLKKDVFLYGSFSQGFVPPEVTELYRTQDVPDLAEATFYNYEVGTGWNIPSTKTAVEVSAYYMKGVNEIIGIRLIDGLTVNRNAAETAHTGLELSVIQSLLSVFQLRLSSTYALHQFVEFREAEDGPDFNGNDMPNAPRWINNAEIMFTPVRKLKGFRAGLEWQMLGEYFVNNNNENSYAGHHLLNFRIGYRAKRYEIWSNIINLGDRIYAESASRNNAGQWRFNPGAPRSINLGISFKIGRS